MPAGGRRLAARLPSEVVGWDGVHFAGGRGHHVQLASPAAAVHGPTPEDLAASVLPLSTACSVSEALGYEDGLDDRLGEVRVLYATYGAVVVLAVVIVLIPGAPPVSILLLSQALDAILLPPLMVFMARMARDEQLMGPHRSGRLAAGAYALTVAVVVACVAALAILALG